MAWHPAQYGGQQHHPAAPQRNTDWLGNGFYRGRCGQNANIIARRRSNRIEEDLLRAANCDRVPRFQAPGLRI